MSLPVYAGSAAAAKSSFGGTVKSINIRYRAPRAHDIGTFRTSANWVRAAKTDIDNAGYPSSVYFRSTDRFMPGGSLDETNGGYWLLNEDVVNPFMLGAKDGEEAASIIQDLLTYLGARGGGRMDGLGNTYLLNSSGVVVNDDHVTLSNFTFKRTSRTAGWLLQFARDNPTEGGGVENATFIGLPTVSRGNGGVLFGSSRHHANRYTVRRVVADSFSQYGMGVACGDGWRIDDVRVVNHGLTVGSISSCIGFFIFPRLASKGGQVSNVFAGISEGCKANASANTAAVKIQTHQRLRARQITADGGSEVAMSIDSVDGTVMDVAVRSQGTNAGLAVGNYNPDHDFSGQTFILDGFKTASDGAASNNEFVIGGGGDGQYKLTGCAIRNGTGGGAGYLIHSNARDCVFENLAFEDIRFDSAARNYPANSLPSINNRYINCAAKGGSLTGVFFLEASESVIDDCGVAAEGGDTVGSFQIRGSNNLIPTAYARNVRGNAITVIGSGNRFGRINLGAVSGRAIWFQPGSDNNVVEAGDLRVGRGVLNSGSSGNRVIAAGRDGPGSNT